MKYRFRLGKTLGSDIITDGTFTQACGVNWDCSVNWTITAGVKASHSGANFDVLTQDCGFVPGTRYKIQFEVTDIPGGGADYVQMFLSGFSVTTNSDNNYYTNTNKTVTVYGTCLSTDSNIRFESYGTASVSAVTAFPYEWNEPLTDHPTNWDESGISLIKSELLDGFYVKYLGNLKFWGDGYDYLIAEYDDLASQSPKEFCKLIYLKIERYVSGAWEEHFTGIIYMNKITFDYKNKTARANVEDIASSQVVRFGADKVLGISYQNRNVYNAVIALTYPSVLCLVKRQSNTAVGRYVYYLYRVLRQLVHEVTDLGVTLDSNLLLDATYESVANVFQYLGITPFKNFSTDVNTYTCYGSINEYTQDLNKIRNIGGLSTYINDIPTLNIESKVTLQTGTYTFTVDNNVGVFDFFEENNWQALKIGFERPNNDDIETLNDPGGFVQFTDWTTDDYYSKTKCTENKLDLVSLIGAHPQWIANQLLTTEYDTSVSPPTGLQAPFTPRNFWLQMEFSTPNYVSRYAAKSGLDLNNPDLEIVDIVDRHVSTLNSSFRSVIWGEAAKTNNPLIRIWEFETPISLSDLNEIIANPNYKIQMTSEHFTGTITGYIVEFEYKNKSDSQGKNIAKFKIISE